MALDVSVATLTACLFEVEADRTRFILSEPYPWAGLYCHVMIHRGTGPALSIDVLRGQLRR